jgi:hypothetical protein
VPLRSLRGVVRRVVRRLFVVFCVVSLARVVLLRCRAAWCSGEPMPCVAACCAGSVRGVVAKVRGKVCRPMFTSNSRGFIGCLDDLGPGPCYVEHGVVVGVCWRGDTVRGLPRGAAVNERLSSEDAISSNAAELERAV